MNTQKEQILALINSENPAEAERYGRIAKKAAEITKELANGFRDRPEWVSGWLHNFVCPDCATRLYFDKNFDFRPGSEYTCPKCGKKY